MIASILSLIKVQTQTVSETVNKVKSGKTTPAEIFVRN